MAGFPPPKAPMQHYPARLSAGSHSDQRTTHRVEKSSVAVFFPVASSWTSKILQHYPMPISLG